MKRFGLAICGLGRAGNIHLKNCYENRRVSVKYLVDSVPQVAERARAHYGLDDVVVLGSDQFDRVLNDAAVDGVIICTPTFSHEDYVKRCISAKKAIFCEKPVAETLADAVSCLDAAEAAGVPIFVAFNRRFDESHAAVKVAVDSGDVGRIQSVTITSRDSPKPSYDYIAISGGIFHDMLIHDIDMGMWMTGEYPVSLHAFGHAFDAEFKKYNDVDTVAVSMQFPSGAMLQINCARLAVYGYDQRVEVFGEKGMVRSENQPITSVQRATGQQFSADCLKYSFPQRYEKAYVAEIDHFLEIMEGQPCRIKKRDVVAASLVACACDESLRSGKAVKIDVENLSFSVL